MASDVMAQVQRERQTQERVRRMDADEVAEWIHRLEDRVERLEEALREIRVKADAEMHYDVIAIVDAALTDGRTRGADDGE